MSLQNIDVAQPCTALVGEGPTWDAASNRLIWVDVLGCEVHRLDPATGADDVVRTSQHVGAAKPRATGGLVVNLRDGIGRYDADLSFDWLAWWPEEGVRGNDAGVDAAGRLWAGTMRYDAAAGGGTLRCVTGDDAVSTVLDNVTVSNGVGWSPDSRYLYYVDTATRRVDVFDFDIDAGLASRRRALVTVDKDLGSPDGLAVDADGGIWIALWNGGAVHRYTPEGRLDRVVAVPVSRPTACAFGGPACADLYITTARYGLDAAQLADQPLAGSILVVPDAGAGLPGTPFTG